MPVLDGGQEYIDSSEKFTEAQKNLTKCQKRIKELESISKQRPLTTGENVRLAKLKQEEKPLQQRYHEANFGLNRAITAALG